MAGEGQATAATPRLEHRAAVAAVKTVHTLAWFSIEAAVVQVLYAGFAKRSDRSVAVAAAVVAGETAVFVGNGFACPLTQVARNLGSERAGVTDIYLPRWFAHNLPAIHVPLLVLAVYLHRHALADLGRRVGSRHGS
jgi:hypothetical protein